MDWHLPARWRAHVFHPTDPAVPGRHHAWAYSPPRWAAALVAGLAAAAVLMVLDFLWSVTVNNDSPWRTAHAIAALVMGPQVLASTAFALDVIVISMVVHYLLGMAFGVALALLIEGFHYERQAGMMQWIAVAFGAVLYLFNFHVMAWFFPWMADLRSWATLIGHLVFAMTAAFVYWKLGRPEAAL